MLGIFSYKQLALVLIVAVMAVAAIGSAAALTYDDSTLNVVQGAPAYDYAADTVDVSYTIGSTGQVTATVDFADADGYTDVSFSHDGGTNYSACTGTVSPDVWDCVMTSGEAYSSTGIDVVAANED